jgi:bifunctional DNA-binding transcriptional regulator/antitoxin component of YhaV-PrlF toxin-antitoxin module
LTSFAASFIIKAEIPIFFFSSWKGGTMSTIAIQIRSKGVITLPMELRRRYGLGEGDVLTLVDLGDGSFLLTPRVLQVPHLADRVSQALSESGVTLDDMLQALDEERERYYHEHYAQS